MINSINASRYDRMIAEVTFPASATSDCVSHRPSSRPALYRQAAANAIGWTPVVTPDDSDSSANVRDRCRMESETSSSDARGDEVAEGYGLGRQSEFSIQRLVRIPLSRLFDAC